MTSNLVSTQWLADHLEDPHMLVLDASWHLPATKRSAREEFLAGHIPGAAFFDLDASSDPNTTLPHMLPSPEKFAADLKRLGASDSKHIICYDSVGLFSAARLWWMLKWFGHERASVLDGGLLKWKTEGRALQSGEATKSEARHFTPHLKPNIVRTQMDVVSALETKSTQLADARSPTRFRGEEPEPRPGVKPGHMPGAHNVHYASLINVDGTLKNKSELKSVFEAAGINLATPVITTCGSGVTAAILYLALAELGHDKTSLYDGSWAEWGASEQEVALGEN
jgi:thiosulfate/3-mercaptopyruvate sulfurtransferase